MQTATPAPVEKDPWLDEFTHKLQQETSAERVASMQEIAQTFNAPEGLIPEVVRNAPEPLEEEGEGQEPVAEQQPVTPPPAAEPQPVEAEPQVVSFEDGSSFSVSRGKKGWVGILDTGIPGAKTENFYGATKEEMYQKLAHAKVHATRKIREQNRIIKLGAPTQAASQAPQTPLKVEKSALTAEELFDLRTKFEANPEEALAALVKKRTGVDIDTLVKKAQAGDSARDEIALREVADDFVKRNPEYHRSEPNFWAIVAYVTKHKLNQTLNDKNKDELLLQLVRTNQWTVENLETAYEDLTESGLLEVAPAAPPKPAEPAQPAPAPTPAATAPPAPPTPPISEREVRRVRQPRAGFGIRQSESTPATPAEPQKPLPVTSFDDLSDADLSELLNAVRKDSQQRR